MTRRVCIVEEEPRGDFLLRMKGERNMSEIDIRLLEAEETDYEVELCATCDGEPCGTLKAFVEDEKLVIVWLAVKEGYRGRGVGTALLHEAEELAKRADLTTLILITTCPAQQTCSTVAWIVRRGFPEPDPGASFLSCRLDSFKDSRMFATDLLTEAVCSHILPVSEISFNALPDKLWQTQEEREEQIDRLSLAFVEKDHVRAALYVTEREEGLYLEDIFMEKQEDGKLLLALLQRMTQLAQPEYETLLVPDKQDARSESFRQLLEGAQVTEMDELMTLRRLDRDEKLLLPEMGAAIVRFNSMVAALAERKIASRLYMPDGGTPHLEIDIGQTDRTAVFYYREAMTDGFVLEASAFSKKDPDTVLIYEEHEEPQEFDSDQVLDTFVLPYLNRAGAILPEKDGVEERGV